jgi:cytochrome c oxidase subunit 2
MKVFGPKVNGYNLQESGNFFMDNIIYFHDLVLCILFFILMLVTWFLVTTLLYFGNPVLFQKCCYLPYNIINFFLYYMDMVAFYYNLYRKETKDMYAQDPILYFVLRLESIKYVNGNHFPSIKFYKSSLSEFLVKHELGYRYYFYSDVKLEFFWTLFPSLVLLLLAIPSFGLLFSIEKVSAPEITVKVIGHQWYWEYQYMDFINVNKIVNDILYVSKEDDAFIIESYMLADEDLSKGQLRLLEVDKKLVLPLKTSIRLLITSDDVLHSWAVPGLGIKVDACPGRINEIIIKIREKGIYYGQCSELCGWYHGFMPIVIQAIPVNEFKAWSLNNFLDVKFLKNVKK